MKEIRKKKKDLFDNKNNNKLYICKYLLPVGVYKD